MPTLTGPPQSAAASAAQDAPIARGRPASTPARVRRWASIRLRLLRPHQYSKNALVFVPASLAGALLQWGSAKAVALAFFALCAAASAGYIVNDILDREEDRRHWSKRERPIASGDIGVAEARATAALLIAVAALCAWPLGPAAGAAIAAYVGLSVVYSTLLKRIALVDVLALASLFTLRLVVGVFAARVALSPWLLTFSTFLFLSLALAKRHTELRRAGQRGVAPAARGYRVEDAPITLTLGCAALTSATLVFVIYLTNEGFAATQLRAPHLLWIMPPLLFVLASRVWLAASRGEMNDDPVVFVFADRGARLLLGLLGAVFMAALVGAPAGRSDAPLSVTSGVAATVDS